MNASPQKKNSGIIEDLMSLFAPKGKKNGAPNNQSKAAHNTKNSASQPVSKDVIKRKEKALKKADTLQNNLLREKNIITPDLESKGWFSKIKTHLYVGLSADNIPLDELNILPHIIFEDNLIKENKMTGKPTDVLNANMIESLEKHLGVSHVASLSEEVWTKTQQIYDVCQDALKYRDFNELGELGHQLRGMALNYGFNKLGTLGKALEKASLTKDINRCDLLIKNIPAISQETQKAHKAWILKRKEEEKLDQI